jgi:hypothetical protein
MAFRNRRGSQKATGKLLQVILAALLTLVKAQGDIMAEMAEEERRAPVAEAVAVAINSVLVSCSCSHGRTPDGARNGHVARFAPR